MMAKARYMMVLGTGSDVGKSLVVTAICRILKNMGIRVVPFKAQNMSNNSYVTVEGGEIGRAQVVQAEAAGLLPSVHMNPVLLKPSTSKGSQVIVQGKVFGNLEADKYHHLKPILKEAVMDSLNRLSKEYDVIIMEGAGSCCEMNIKEHDIVNFPLAKEVGASCIIVGDIEKGGIFAQLIGTYHLMDNEEKRLTKGFLINKFRGDPSLFDSGIEYLERYTSIPVLGVIPYIDNIHIDPEDSVVIQKHRINVVSPRSDAINIGVVRLPAISNFTDMEILLQERDVILNYLFRPDELTGMYDCLIIPGTKNVMEDCLWMKKTGWDKKIKEYIKDGGMVFGICGGYQLLGVRIRDPYGVESDKKEVKGLGLLSIETILSREKVVREVKGRCLINNRKIKGYEIHMGESRPIRDRGMPYLKLFFKGQSWKDGWISEDKKIMGTYVHGIMDSAGFREDFLNRIRKKKGLKPKRARRISSFRSKEYDRLASYFERHCNTKEIIKWVMN